MDLGAGVPTAPLTSAALQQLALAQAQAQAQEHAQVYGAASTPYLSQPPAPLAPAALAGMAPPPFAPPTAAADLSRSFYPVMVPPSTQSQSPTPQSPTAACGAAPAPPDVTASRGTASSGGRSGGSAPPPLDASITGLSPFAQASQARFSSRDVSRGSGGRGSGGAGAGSPRPQPAPAPPSPPRLARQHLADAAATAQRVAAHKTLEQQRTGAAVAAAAATAAAAVDPGHRAHAAAQAVYAQAAYEAATQEAAAAQSQAERLLHGAVAAATAAEPPPQPAVVSTAGGYYSAPLAGSPPSHVPSFGAGLGAGLLGTSAGGAGAPAAAAVSPLAQAAATAKQTAAQKHMESQAAAAAYQSAASQAAGAAEPTHAAVANAVAQQAAQMYQAAVNEAANAAAAAAHLEQAAAALAPPAPASAPLAAQIAAGIGLQPGAGQYPGGLGLLAPTALYPGLSGLHAEAGATLQQPPPAAYAAAPSLQALPHQGQLQQLQQQQAGFAGAFPGGGGAAVSQVPSQLQSYCQGLSTPLPSDVLMPTTTLSSLGLSSGLPTPPGLPTFAAATPPLAPPPPPEPPAIVKAVCSSGGAFIRSTGGGGGWDYEGGETRLINLPFGCSAEVLFATLERATSSLTDSTDVSYHDDGPVLKYRLPSDPTVWVDLLDDDDVAMMFEEVGEATAAAGVAGGGTGGGSLSPKAAGGSGGGTGGSGGAGQQPKLHIYVQWRGGEGRGMEGVSTPSGGDSGGAGPGGSSGDGASVGSSPRQGQPPPQPQQLPDVHVAVPEGSDAPAQPNAEGPGPQSPAADAPAPAPAPQPPGSPPGERSGPRRRRKAGAAGPRPSHASSIDLPDLLERMEIIDPGDISLVRFLGSGGFGDVYLGRWHGCEVAVKCLNPALFFQGGGDGGGINRAAVTDLIREADVIASLRHPNIVWCYGIVLPDMKRGAGIVDTIQAEAGAPSMMPGVLRPPALVTEYMAGGSLKTALTRRADIVAGPLTRIVLALDAAKGVEYLHSKHLVHFDLKSGNLLLGYRDRRPVCKVADFGLTRERTQTFVSGVTSQRGTLPWMAPEILRTPQAVTEAVDVFSFAIIMWELWTSKEPYEGINYHNLMMQLADPGVQRRPPVPGTPEWEGGGGEGGAAAPPPPELAPGWRDLMERCWDDDPAVRPTFAQIVKELRGMIAAVRPPKDRGGGGGGSLGRVKSGT